MVPQATSFPLFENFSEPSKETSLYTFEACARPSSLGICPAVGLMSEELLYCFVRSTHWPFSSNERVAK